MALHRPSFRIATPSLLLAVALVSGSAAPAIARDATDAPSSPGGVFGGSAARLTARTQANTTDPSPVAVGRRVARDTPTIDRTTGAGTEVRPVTPDVPTARPIAVSRTKSTPTPTASGDARGGTTGYRGRNHVWIPGLGVNRSIAFFSCSSNAYPGNRVYRWGCAGSNNVYLFGHASSVFGPLHDAYIAGRLRKGMAVYYANDDGVVHRYTVRWWKVTTPDKGAWAYASQSTPSLTLQTCVGARSQYRLIVRLTQSD